MDGPRPRGFWTARIPPTVYRHLVPGRRYRVALPFTDYDRAEHPVGETWWFRGWNYSPHDSGLSLFVSLDGEREWHFRMADWEGEQQGIIDALAAHVVDAEGPIREQG